MTNGEDFPKQTLYNTGSGTGTAKGVIEIQKITGNNLGSFGCKDLKVTVHEMHSATGKAKWVRTTAATGSFSQQSALLQFPMFLPNLIS